MIFIPLEVKRGNLDEMENKDFKKKTKNLPFFKFSLERKDTKVKDFLKEFSKHLTGRNLTQEKTPEILKSI